MSSRSPRFLDSAEHRPTFERYCLRLACGLAVVLSVLGAIAGFSAWHANYHSGIYEFEQPKGSKHRASQTGDGFEVLRGVNLGGWLVLEPWIVPSLFYQFITLEQPAVDEKTFCKVLGTEEAKRQLDAFRKAWVTEETFRKIKEIGLNAVRIPYGYWSWGDQPDFCPGINSIGFLDSAVDWAEKYGLRVLLDLHGAQGSQNGFDNSGDSYREPFSATWHNGSSNCKGEYCVPWDAEAWISPAYRHVGITKEVLAKTVARYGKRPHVSMFGLINEPIGFWTPLCKSGSCPLNQDLLTRYYEEAYAEAKEKMGPEMAGRASPVLDVSFRPTIWQSLRESSTVDWGTAGAWGAMMDWHRYFSFDHLSGSLPQIHFLRQAACNWREELQWVHEKQLPTIIGEWSLAVTDCMTWLNGYGIPTFFNHGSVCDYEKCPQTFGEFPEDTFLPGLEGSGTEKGFCSKDPRDPPTGKLDFDQFYTLLARYQMRGHERSRGWFFWSFKCEIADPRWCFIDAWERGWFPKNMSVDAYEPPIVDCDSRETLFGNLQNTLAVASFCSVSLLVLVFSSCCALFVSRCGHHCRIVREPSLKQPAVAQVELAQPLSGSFAGNRPPH